MIADEQQPDWPLHGVLLLLWFAASFGVVFFARDLEWVVAGWPVGFWFAAQGSLLIFLGIVVVFAWLANRREAARSGDEELQAPAVVRRLHRRFGCRRG